MDRNLIRLGNAVFLLTVLLGQFADAQNPRKSPPQNAASDEPAKANRKLNPTKTIVDVVLLQTDDRGALYAQQWLKVFQDLDINFDTRRPLTGEKAELKERESGYTRFITAIGTLDRSGQIAFPDRTFAASDGAKLKEWIAELKTYGVLGTPAGKPNWGLTKSQFTAIYDGLANPVTTETDGLTLTQFINQLTFPEDSPLRWSVDAKAILARQGDGFKLKSELKGISSATALAIALNENHMGFRPNRTPGGSIELLVEPRTSTNRLWPIGYELSGQKRPIKAAPKMFTMMPIELSDQPLSDVITAAESLTEIPIVIDHPELQSRDIDLDKIEVSFPLTNCNWNTALKRMLGRNRLAQDLREDEAGRIFVWLTAMRSGRTSE